MALAVTAAIAATLAVPAAYAAEPETGSISGRLVSATGAAIAGDVTAIDETGRAATARAESDGSYEITGLATGRYAVRFEPSRDAVVGARYGYVDAWFPDKRHRDDATLVTVNPGSETLFVDSALTAAARITGRVGGTAGEWAVALLDEPPPADPFDGDTTATLVAPDGAFELRASAYDDYALLVYRKSGDRWLPYHYDLDGEFGFEVAAGDDIEVFSLESLPAPGALVFDLRLPDGSPAAGFAVTASRQSTAPLSRDGVTDAAGRVVFDEIPPGTWAISVNEADRVYPPLFLRGMPVVSGRTSDLTSSLAAPLPLDMTATPGQITADLRLLLDRTGTRLEMADTDGLESVEWVLDDDASGEARRGDFGFSPTDGWFADVPTDAVVDRGALGITLHYERDLTMLTIADVVVEPVRDESALTPATRGIVDAPDRVEATRPFDITGVRAGEWYQAVFFSDAVSVGWVQAADSGAVSVVAPAGLSGAHRVALWTVDGDLLGWDDIDVFAGPTTPGAISGRMVTDDGVVAPGVVQAIRKGGDTLYEAVPTLDGSYALEVDPGEYIVQFLPTPVANVMVPWGWADQYFRLAADITDAEPVVVAPGAAVRGVDAGLVDKGAANGRVDGRPGTYAVLLTRPDQRAPSGDPFIAGALVAEVATDGTWEVAAPPGTYQATLYGEFAGGWQQIFEWQDGERFDIRERAATTVDFTVPDLGGLVLVVLDPAGAPVEGAAVAITSAGAGPVHRLYTDAEGTATIDGLLVGQQLLSVRGPSPLSRLAIDGLEVATGTPETLTVTLGDPLPRGFSVTGARTVEDDLLVDRGTLGMSVPAAAGVDGVSARLSLFEQLRASDVVEPTVFALKDGVWSGELDASQASGPGELMIAVDEVGLHVRTFVSAIAPAIIDPAALTDETRGGLSSPATVVAGTSLAVSGLEPGEWYSYGVTGSPVGAWVQASASGVATVPIAADAPLGSDRVALFDIDGDLVGWTSVAVVAAGALPGSGSLAATGSTPAWMLAMAAIALLGAGAVLAARRRRVRL